uniref:Uncharacterized protein n=1 Tax=Ananas comosus var. bracteatus TaxID=296719 RepID=A0A6V7QHQ7_ANACO|nr:unnamed protein product [Ananas comosus var. bracteatus]
MGRSKAPVVETSTVAQPSTTQHVAPADNEGQGESDRHRSNQERLVDLEAQLNRLDKKVTKVAAHEERVTMLEVTLAQLVEQVAELQDNTKEAVHHLKKQTIELGPHFVRSCPQRKSLNAMQTKDPESDEEEEAAETGSIRVGALRTTRAMVDTGATHNFIATGEAERLGITLSKDGSHESSKLEDPTIAGLAKEVPVSIGSWTGKANFTSVPLDDFQVILEM